MQYLFGFVFVLSLYILSLQILTSVPLMSITVMQMLSVIILMDITTAHAALDILEMEHHAPVNYQGICIFKRPYIIATKTGGNGGGEGGRKLRLCSVISNICLGLFWFVLTSKVAEHNFSKSDLSLYCVF